MQIAGRRIGEHLRPDWLGLTHDYRVGVLQGLVRLHRGMNSAKHYRLASTAIPIGNLVGATGLDSHGGDAHQVDIGVIEANSVAQMFLHDGNVMHPRRDRRQELKRGALDFPPAQANARIRIRVDKSDSQIAFRLGRRQPFWNMRKSIFSASINPVHQYLAICPSFLCHARL